MYFAAVNTALSALRYNQVAMETASHNIANVGTDGYTRRRVEASSAGTPTTPAMWSRNQSTVGGVVVDGTTRIADGLLDARARTEHGRQAYLDTRQAVLDRLESGIGEPGDTGVAQVMTEFRQAWADLANNPGIEAARSQVIARGAALADALAIQVRNFSVEAGDQRVKLDVMLTEVDTLGADLAATNLAIQAATLDGSERGNLLDQRDLLVMRLAELTGGEARQTADGGMDFAVNGVALVTGAFAGRLEPKVDALTGEPATPYAFQVVHPLSGVTDVPAIRGGQVGAVVEMVDTTIPDYLAKLAAVATTLADGVNAVHSSAYDAAGVTGRDFFGYDPDDPAGTLTVLVSRPGEVAASGVAGGVVEGAKADRLAELTGHESAYQELVNVFGTTVASARRVATSQQTLTQQVDMSRDQLSGVSLDEEMLSMVQFQRGYEAAARVLTTVDSMLDTLINRTGLLR